MKEEPTGQCTFVSAVQNAAKPWAGQLTPQPAVHSSTSAANNPFAPPLSFFRASSRPLHENELTA